MTTRMKEELEKALQDEVQDHEKYLHLSELAKTEGCEKMSKILRDIAEEERVHGRYIMSMVKEHD